MYVVRSNLLALCVCTSLVLCCPRERQRTSSDPSPSASTTAAPVQDSRYRLDIAGDPTLFEPGELYTVSLKSAENGSERISIYGFTLWAEAEGEENQSKENRGSFQTYDSQSKSHEDCPGALVNSTATAKNEIQAIWSAPVHPSGCVVFAAHVGDDSHAGGDWSTLERRLCPAERKISGSQPPIISPCCACDEAKYEVTFEGLWSRNTHPRDFPADERITRFSDVIGASHTVHYRFWEVGRVASQGLRELAEEGHTTTLEKELKAESDNIRTIIKARGMSWPRLSGATFAVFRVDARRHLVSLVSRLSPSPDWVVGVSALELCRPNCTWLESDTIELFPYDAGTDSGITYMSRRQRTIPAGPVRALRPDWPRDPRSPFYDPSDAVMKPFARMRLTRQRLYEKNCDTQAVSPGRSSHAGPASSSGGTSSGGAIMSAEREQWGPCATGAWGAWSSCSVSCGVGVVIRQRYYLEPARAEFHSCRRPLTDKKLCRGPRMHCRAPSEYEPEIEAGRGRGACDLTAWSEWSPCSARECDVGVRMRIRNYVYRGAVKRCHQGWRNKPSMDQTIECTREDNNCTFEIPEITTTTSSTSLVVLDPISNDNSTNGTWIIEMGGRGWEEVACPVSPWGSWSTCSARCGRGWRMRTRFYLAPPAPHNNLTALHQASRLQRRLTAHLTQVWNRRFAAWQNIEFGERERNEMNTHDHLDQLEQLDQQLREQLERCEFTLTMQDVECEAQHPHCHLRTNTSEVCALPLAVGSCRGYSERWFYDTTNRNCEPFGYTGCRGNENNFHTRQQCLDICGNFTGEPVPVPPVLTNTHFKHKQVKTQSDASYNDLVRNDAPAGRLGRAVAVDCVVGPWSGWSECTGDCVAGLKLNYRLVLRAAERGGRDCPRNLLKSRICRPEHCRGRGQRAPAHIRRRRRRRLLHHT